MGGAAAPAGAAGAWLSVILAAHGMDKIYAGYRTISSGQYTRTVTSQALDSLTGSRETSETVEAIGSMAIGMKAIGTIASRRAISLEIQQAAKTIAPKGAGLLEIPTKSLQKVFDKHGAHFGLSANWNPSRAADVLNAIKNHMGAAGTKIVDGTYRGQRVFHHVDPATGLNVITDLNGKFIGGWKLGLEQLERVLTTGRLF